MQTLLNPEMLSIEVKQDLNIATAAAVAVVGTKVDAGDSASNRKPGVRLELGNLPENAILVLIRNRS